MLMNRVETVLVNSPPRRWLQRYEARVLTALGGRTPGAHVAELGCGSGYGTRLILDEFGAARVDAVDLDPAMISRARHRLRRHTGRAHLARGSATDLRSAFHDVGGGQNGTYDAVFDFAIIHHIPNWRKPWTRWPAYSNRVGGSSLTRSPRPPLLGRPTKCCLTIRARIGSPPVNSCTSCPTTVSTSASGGKHASAGLPVGCRHTAIVRSTWWLGGGPPRRRFEPSLTRCSG
ncbi:Methyltransferase domain-containing protein [Gordonia westfalica]|uniref:Methyltransferase domain-containing protein n=1 Tax=Gordonia westfalica TaxID=158898 RepID=A0A1H2E9U1_9ACTN|nr:Methyltransferase domain-containing protein [Gordonia westfalica]